MVSSLDGFIAKPDESVDWMHSKNTFEKGKELTEEYITNFLKSIGCYVMGSRTYEHALALGWPYGDTPVVVLTSRDLQSDKESVKFYQGDIETLVRDQLTPFYDNIWMVGGAVVTKDFLQRDLADEIVITIVPIILGEGKPFFDKIKKEKELQLLDVAAFKDGMVEITYKVKKSEEA